MELSFTAAKWARSIWCAAPLALAACAAAPPPAPVPPAPSPAPAASETIESTDIVQWDATASTITCVPTESAVRIPNEWRDVIRRIDASEVDLPSAGERRGVFLARGSEDILTGAHFVDDIKRLLVLAKVPIPKQLAEAWASYDGEVVPFLTRVDLNLPPMEIEQDTPGAEPLMLSYHLVQREDGTCRFASLDFRPYDGELPVDSLVYGVRTPVRPGDPSQWITDPPAGRRSIPRATCEGWPVWRFPRCGPERPPKAAAGKQAP